MPNNGKSSHGKCQLRHKKPQQNCKYALNQEGTISGLQTGIKSKSLKTILLENQH
jgi:hypothetical protein